MGIIKRDERASDKFMFGCKFHKSRQQLNRHELVRTLAPDDKSRKCAADGKCWIICKEGCSDWWQHVDCYVTCTLLVKPFFFVPLSDGSGVLWDSIA